MGLDMYLYAEKYHDGGWQYVRERNPEKAAAFDVMLTAAGFEPSDMATGSSGFMTTLTVAYWRKANMIHAWFVQNCQDGRDECQRSYVDRSQLDDLRVLCQEALTRFHAGAVVAVGGDQTGTAAELLPVQGGFFFGSTAYGENYAEDLQDTIDQLNRVLANERLSDCEFYYHSSW